MTGSSIRVKAERKLNYCSYRLMHVAAWSNKILTWWKTRSLQTCITTIWKWPDHAKHFKIQPVRAHVRLCNTEIQHAIPSVVNHHIRLDFDKISNICSHFVCS